MPSSRGRRILVAALALPTLFLGFLYLGSQRPWGLNPFAISAAAESSTAPPEEIFGLLHFVTSPDEQGRVLTLSDGVDAPVDMAWYARGSITKMRRPGRAATEEWNARLDALRETYPLVVFSKTYCPYSKRAKKLLEGYDLSPAPKIVEVDLRADASEIKALLTRLTQRSTFPNVILHGHSLGGSDDLMLLHEEDQLRHVLEQGGVQVRRTRDDIMI